MGRSKTRRSKNLDRWVKNTQKKVQQLARKYPVINRLTSMDSLDITILVIVVTIVHLFLKRRKRRHVWATRSVRKVYNKIESHNQKPIKKSYVYRRTTLRDHNNPSVVESSVSSRRSSADGAKVEANSTRPLLGHHNNKETKDVKSYFPWSTVKTVDRDGCVVDANACKQERSDSHNHQQTQSYIETSSRRSSMDGAMVEANSTRPLLGHHNNKETKSVKSFFPWSTVKTVDRDGCVVDDDGSPEESSSNKENNNASTNSSTNAVAQYSGKSVFGGVLTLRPSNPLVQMISTSQEGCYLTYETDSGGRLMLQYQQRGRIPNTAVAFWAPGKGEKLLPFKFERNGGKSELVRGIAGGDSNRRKYFNGWCQFVKLAANMKGSLKKYPGHGVDVDVYFYRTRLGGQKNWGPCLLDLNTRMVDISTMRAVAVVPKNHDFLQGVNTMALSTFMEKGAIAGASTTLITS